MKNVFVTGGNRGIGKAIVERFSKSGEYNIAFTYNNNLLQANEVVDSLKGDTKIQCYQMNLLDKASIEQATNSMLKDFGNADIVIHNAAFCDDAAFYFMDESKWNDVISASLNSFFYINKLCIPEMIGNKWGRIITMASVSGESGNRGQANYAAAKGALIAASKSLAKEIARKNILVNVVSPGIIDTEMTKDVPFEHVKHLIPVGRTGRPEEVASAVYFLSSEEASYINGTVLQVNGGMYT